MERVFTTAERVQILDAVAPTLALWKAWSAKEAAYKVAKFLIGKGHRKIGVIAGDIEGGGWLKRLGVFVSDRFLYEGHDNFDMIYGAVPQGGSSATVGVQSCTTFRSVIGFSENATLASG